MPKFKFSGTLVELKYSKTQTTHDGETRLREVVYLSRLKQNNFSSSPFSSDYQFESEHLSFDKYPKAGLPPLHLSIRYQNNSNQQHYVIRVDLEVIDNQIKRKANTPVSIKEYQTGEFPSAKPVTLKNKVGTKLERKIEEHLKLYDAIFENLLLAKGQQCEQLTYKYNQLEAIISDKLSHLAEHQHNTEKNEALKKEIYDFLAIIDKLNRYRPSAHRIGENFIREQLQKLESVAIFADLETEPKAETKADETINTSSPSSANTSNTETSLPISISSTEEKSTQPEQSTQERYLNEAATIIAELKKLQCRVFIKLDTSYINKIYSKTNALFALLGVLNILGTSDIIGAQEKMVEYKEALAYFEAILENYNELKKSGRITSSSSEGNKAAGWEQARANAGAKIDMLRCESESASETSKNRQLKFIASTKTLATLLFTKNINDPFQFMWHYHFALFSLLAKHVDQHTLINAIGEFFSYSENIKCEYFIARTPLQNITSEPHNFPAPQYLNMPDKITERQKQLLRHTDYNIPFVHFIHLPAETITLPKQKMNTVINIITQQLPAQLIVRPPVTPEDMQSIKAQHSFFQDYVNTVFKNTSQTNQHFQLGQCKAALWLFNRLWSTPNPDTYIMLCKVFCFMQKIEGIKQANCFEIINNIFLTPCPHPAFQSKVKSSAEYKSLEVLVTQQIQERSISNSSPTGHGALHSTATESTSSTEEQKAKPSGSLAN